jgi:hypothetical protein
MGAQARPPLPVAGAIPTGTTVGSGDHSVGRGDGPVPCSARLRRTTGSGDLMPHSDGLQVPRRATRITTAQAGEMGRTMWGTRATFLHGGPPDLQLRPGVTPVHASPGEAEASAVYPGSPRAAYQDGRVVGRWCVDVDVPAPFAENGVIRRCGQSYGGHGGGGEGRDRQSACEHASEERHDRVHL